ncbi:MAG: hypothetical protein O2779_04565 [Nanoarchaeota archaeon]|nr:hypothetical protein [Nanoarchaeota archaeon]
MTPIPLSQFATSQASTQVENRPVGNGPGWLGWGAVALAVMLMLLDYITGFNGIRIEVLIRNITFGIIGGGDIAANPLIRMVWGIQFWGIMIIWAVFRKYSPEIPFLKAFPRVGAAVLAVLFVGFSGGFFSAAGMAHMMMAFAFNFLVLEKAVPDFRRAREIAIYYLLVDFIGYGILDYFADVSPILQLFSNRIVVPIWLYGCFYFMSDKEKKAGIGLWLLLMFNLFMVANAIIFPIMMTNAVQFDTAQQRLEAMVAVGTAYDNVKTVALSGIASFKTGLYAGIDEASGGYYKSNNPDNEDPTTRLGFYFRDVKPAYDQFAVGQKPRFSGNLDAVKLDLKGNKEEIRVSMACTGVDTNGKKVEGEITPKDIEKKTNVEGREIQSQEDIYFECSFARGQLQVGSSSVDISAGFNFQTVSTLASHWVSEGQARAYRYQGVDPLVAAGISNRRPVAVPSSGPVKLGIGTNEDPVQLRTGKEEVTNTFVGITLERYWPGKIAKVHSLKIVLPSGFKMDLVDGKPCSGEFEPGDQRITTIAGAEEIVQETYQLVSNEDHVGINSIKVPILNHVSWRCPITITAEEAKKQLGTGVVVTRYFEALVTYDFEIEQKIPTYVKIDASAPKTPEVPKTDSPITIEVTP